MALSRGGHLWLRNSSRYEEVGLPSFSPGPMYKPWALPSARAAGQDARWSWDKRWGWRTRRPCPPPPPSGMAPRVNSTSRRGQAAPRRGSGLRWEDFDLPRTGGTKEHIPGAELRCCLRLRKVCTASPRQAQQLGEPRRSSHCPGGAAATLLPMASAQPCGELAGLQQTESAMRSCSAWREAELGLAKCARRQIGYPVIPWGGGKLWGVNKARG